MYRINKEQRIASIDLLNNIKKYMISFKEVNLISSIKKRVILNYKLFNFCLKIFSI